jgi:hypothetical protein
VDLTFAVVTHSGHVVVFDPAAVVLPETRPPDLETLQAGAAQGSILWSHALDDETMVRVLVDQPLPGRLPIAAVTEFEQELRVPSGRLWVADPTYLHPQQRPISVPEEAGRQLTVPPGTYRATIRLLEPQGVDMDRELRRTVGRLPVALRDGLGFATFLLAALTVIGLPVYLLGRAIDGGLSGVLDGLVVGLSILAPLWLVVLVGWRLPVLRRVDRADEDIARRHPDLVVTLEPATRS